MWRRKQSNTDKLGIEFVEAHSAQQALKLKCMMKCGSKNICFQEGNFQPLINRNVLGIEVGQIWISSLTMEHKSLLQKWPLRLQPFSCSYQTEHAKPL
jgi:hypothetical protein